MAGAVGLVNGDTQAEWHAMSQCFEEVPFTFSDFHTRLVLVARRTSTKQNTPILHKAATIVMESDYPIYALIV